MNFPHIIRKATDPANPPPELGIHWINTITGDAFFSTGTVTLDDWTPQGGGGSGGGFIFLDVQIIDPDGTISLTDKPQVVLNVKGNAGPTDANLKPFAANPADGAIIVLIGQDDTCPLKITYSDTMDGCLLTGGDCYLGKDDTLMLIRNKTKQRYNELSRSIH